MLTSRQAAVALLLVTMLTAALAFIYGNGIVRAAVIGAGVALLIEVFKPWSEVVEEEEVPVAQLTKRRNAVYASYLYVQTLEFLNQDIGKIAQEMDEEELARFRNEKTMLARLAIADLHNRELISSELAQKGIAMIYDFSWRGSEIHNDIWAALVLALSKQEAEAVVDLDRDYWMKAAGAK